MKSESKNKFMVNIILVFTQISKKDLTMTLIKIVNLQTHLSKHAINTS